MLIFKEINTNSNKNYWCQRKNENLLYVIGSYYSIQCSHIGVATGNYTICTELNYHNNKIQQCLLCHGN